MLDDGRKLGVLDWRTAYELERRPETLSVHEKEHPASGDWVLTLLWLK